MSSWWIALLLALWMVVLVLIGLGLALLRQLGLIYLRLGGALGARQTLEGPAFGQTIEIPERHIRALSRDSSLLVLLFLSPTCSICGSLVQHLGSYARSLGTEVDLAAVLDEDDLRGKFLDLANTKVPIIVDAEMHKVCEVPGLPYALALDPERRVVSKGVVNNLVQVESVINEGLLATNLSEARVT